eukprot:6207731-Pleurochrysis_carterae.AAC.1
MFCIAELKELLSTRSAEKSLEGQMRVLMNAKSGSMMQICTGSIRTRKYGYHANSLPVLTFRRGRPPGKGGFVYMNRTGPMCPAHYLVCLFWQVPMTNAVILIAPLYAAQRYALAGAASLGQISCP